MLLFFFGPKRGELSSSVSSWACIDVEATSGLEFEFNLVLEYWLLLLLEDEAGLVGAEKKLFAFVVLELRVADFGLWDWIGDEGVDAGGGENEKLLTGGGAGDEFRFKVGAGGKGRRCFGGGGSVIDDDGALGLLVSWGVKTKSSFLFN